MIHFAYNFTTTRFRFLRDIEDMIGRMNIVARVYFMSMWYVGTPAMILFIIIYAFIGYDTIAANYAGSYGTVLVDGIEVIASNLIYPDWTNVIGKNLTVTPYFGSNPIFSDVNDIFTICTNCGVFNLCSYHLWKRCIQTIANMEGSKCKISN